jgi:hypothetical protein
MPLKNESETSNILQSFWVTRKRNRGFQQLTVCLGRVPETDSHKKHKPVRRAKLKTQLSGIMPFTNLVGVFIRS